MNTIQAWQLLLVTLAGWMNRHQQDVIEYIQEENRILKQRLKGKRIRFTDDERRRWQSKASRCAAAFSTVLCAKTFCTFVREFSPSSPMIAQESSSTLLD